MVSGNQAVALIALAGGGAYLLTHQDPGYRPAGTPPPSQPSSGKALVNVTRASRYKLDAAALRQIYATPAEKVGNGGSPNSLPKEVEEQIKADLKKQWDAASGAARTEICNRLKSQFPNDASVQSMQCGPNVAFQAILTAAAAAAGTVICGPPCGAVGILVAAWAGPKLEEWARAAGDKLKDAGSRLADDFSFWNW